MSGDDLGNLNIWDLAICQFGEWRAGDLEISVWRCLEMSGHLEMLVWIFCEIWRYLVKYNLEMS